jgi:hypothetical protein
MTSQTKFSGHEGHVGLNDRIEGQVLGHFFHRLPRIDDVTIAVGIGCTDVVVDSCDVK